jgi:hypothetical protein
MAEASSEKMAEASSEKMAEASSWGVLRQI